MKVRRLLQMLCLTILFTSSSFLYAQTQSNFNWQDVVPWLLAAVALTFGIYQYAKRRRDTKQKKLAELEAEEEFKRKKQGKKDMTDEEKYRATLKEELGHIDLLGSPDIESKTVKLEDAFVTLCISESWRSEERFHPKKKMEDFEIDRRLTPEQVMTRAFKKDRLLLVIGDPGSGKTTLLKYYSINCLDKKYREFGFTGDVFPIFFPLRELEFNKKNNEPTLLPQNLEKWLERHLLNITAQQFHDWFHKRKTLVLLDGLDEISSKEQRQKVCRWIKDMCNGLKNACFVVTSRSTGYRKLDGIELEVPHLRADIMDFSPDQQELFLKKWYRAVYSLELPPEGKREQEWKEKQWKLAEKKSQAIVEFLNNEDNKAVRELAAVPMLLQIMAIIWKERDYLPGTRLELYEAALNYLLEYRDRQKDIGPVLPAKEARRVLAPTALWMQEQLKKDEAPKQEMHNYMQPILDTLKSRTNASVFCENLRDRAGLIAELKDHYIFRHKSFREFLAGIQLKEDAHKEKRIETLVKHFKDDWWEETLRFFISKANDEIFDRFIRAFFKSEVSQELDAHRQTLLQHLVREAPQKKIDALTSHLKSDSLNSRQRRYVMDCLKTIGTPEAIKAIEDADKIKLDESNLSYAEDIIAEAAAKPGTGIKKLFIKEPLLQDSFRNIVEGNVEYIKIPGGTYRYSVSKQMVTVTDLYFCKYLVTNRRYRRFIAYLQGKDKEFEKVLPVDRYAQLLLKFASSDAGYSQYLAKYTEKWQEEFRSGRDEDRKFNGDDQPVVAVPLYASRAYCFWLSCLETVINLGRKIEDINQVADIYRLPTEQEWEWAAGGNPDGTIRKYPWPKEKGGPTPNLANFNHNVGATTPVGRYPEGATPHGLLDMAGNAWERMENYAVDKDPFVLRGGSWFDNEGSIACSSRNFGLPVILWDDGIGFRVVRASLPVI